MIVIVVTSLQEREREREFLSRFRLITRRTRVIGSKSNRIVSFISRLRLIISVVSFMRLCL